MRTSISEIVAGAVLVLVIAATVLFVGAALWPAHAGKADERIGRLCPRPVILPGGTSTCPVFLTPAAPLQWKGHRP